MNTFNASDQSFNASEIEMNKVITLFFEVIFPVLLLTFLVVVGAYASLSAIYSGFISGYLGLITCLIIEAMVIKQAFSLSKAIS